MSSDRDMEQERLQRDAVRAGFLETSEGWVRVATIAYLRPVGQDQTEVFLIGGEQPRVRIVADLPPAQLLRAIVAAQGRDVG